MTIPHEYRLYTHVGPDGIPYDLVVAHNMFTLQELLEKIVEKVLRISQIVQTVPKAYA